jgi:hypothetical protein
MKGEGKYRFLVCLGIFQGVFGASIAGIGLASVEHGHNGGALVYLLGLIITMTNAITFMLVADIRVKWTEDLYKPKEDKEKSG